MRSLPAHTRRITLALLMAAGLGACSAAPVTRDAPPAPTLDTRTSVEPGAVARLSDFSVAAININVPVSLQVSERNAYYPGGDIVWHGDTPGNRHQQVKAIMQAGLEAGVKTFTGARSVVLDVEVTRFHSLSPRARYTIGGVHSVNFYLRVRDAKTGDVLIPSYHIEADLEAYGGATAVTAEALGDTQKRRVITHIARVIQTELRQPGSFVATGIGVMGRINNL